MTRELVWQLPGERASIREVEIQIYDEGELLKREVLSYPAGLSFDIVQKMSLRDGQYPARVFVRREGRTENIYSPTIHVGSEETITVIPDN
ncbi:MAG: hypothetical protein ACOZIN_20360 [Myxococcota bacterium]